MIKNQKLIACLLIGLASVSSAYAFYNDNGRNSSVGVWTELGYTGMTANVGFNRAPGYATGLGLSYELQAGHFLMEMGAGFLWQDVGTWEYSMGSTFDAVDNSGNPYKLTYSLSGRFDHTRNGYVRIPIMFGGRFKRFYFLMGAKTNVPTFGRTKVSANVSVSGAYPDGHIEKFYTEVPHTDKGPKLDLNLDVDAALEVGLVFAPHGTRVNFGSSTVEDKLHFRLAIYADYGLVNLHKGHDSDLPYYKFSSADRPSLDHTELTHIFRSEHANGQNIHNVFGGVKFTIIFPSQR